MHICISSSILKCICMHNGKNYNQVWYTRTYLPYLSRWQCFYPKYLKTISVVKNAHCCSSCTWHQSPDPLAPSQCLNAGCIGSILHSWPALGWFGHRTLCWTALMVWYLKSRHENLNMYVPELFCHALKGHFVRSLVGKQLLPKEQLFCSVSITARSAALLLFIHQIFQIFILDTGQHSGSLTEPLL